MVDNASMFPSACCIGELWVQFHGERASYWWQCETGTTCWDPLVTLGPRGALYIKFGPLKQVYDGWECETKILYLGIALLQ